jgi:hypothetical protein
MVIRRFVMKGACLVKTYIVVAFLVLSTSAAALAQTDYCEANFDYDYDVDGTDAFTFKTDFGRSLLKNPCPPDGPSPVRQTGQTMCYDADGSLRDCEGTGEDGEYQKGVAWPNPRFTDNLNGTITDNLTGLIWLKNANCFGVSSWNQALLDCGGLASGSCGLTDGSIPGDWRLSNLDEFLSLVDRSQTSPALPSGNPFTDVQTSIYWSSTTSAASTDSAWYVFLEDGYTDFNDKDTGNYVWPVRGGR